MTREERNRPHSVLRLIAVGLVGLSLAIGGCVQVLGDFEIGAGGSGGEGGAASSVGGSGGAPGLDIGSACDVPQQCASAHCADGVCCDTACDGACTSCAIVGDEGTCGPHPAASDPENECGFGSCDGAGSCASADHTWSQAFGPDGRLTQLEVDENGNIAVVGQWEGTVDLGDGPINTPGAERYSFFARFGPDGTLLHRRIISTDGTNLEFRQMDVDATGAAYLLGVIEGTSGDLLRVDGTAYPSAAVRSSLDMVVGKIDADGSVAWFRSYGAASGSFFQPYGIAADDQGRVSVSGVTNGDFDVGGGPVTQGMLVARLTPTGDHDWSFGYTNAQPQDLTLDESGNVVIAGILDGNVSFQGKTLSPLGPASFFLVEFNGETGSHVWSAAYGDDVVFDLLSHYVATASNGDLCVAGTIRGNTDFGGGSFNAPSTEGFMARFSTNGEHRWSYHLPELVPNGFGGPYSAASDPQDNCLFAGHFVDAPDFGAGAMPSSGGRDFFVAKYNPAGALLVARSFGDTENQRRGRVAGGPDGSLIVGGYNIDASIDFGGGELQRIFLAKLSP